MSGKIVKAQGMFIDPTKQAEVTEELTIIEPEPEEEEVVSTYKQESALREAYDTAKWQLREFFIDKLAAPLLGIVMLLVLTLLYFLGLEICSAYPKTWVALLCSVLVLPGWLSWVMLVTYLFTGGYYKSMHPTRGFFYRLIFGVISLPFTLVATYLLWPWIYALFEWG